MRSRSCSRFAKAVQGGETVAAALAVGVACLTLILILQRLWPIFPSVLAAVLLAIAALFVAFILPPPRIIYVEGLLLFYSAFAAILLMALLRPHQLPSKLPSLVQAADVAFVAILALFPIGDTVPFFSFLLFPLFTAASRWGFQQVMITTAIRPTIRPYSTAVAPRSSRFSNLSCAAAKKLCRNA